MRILHLVHQYPPQYTTGTEVLTHETAKAQIAAGHQVEVLAAELVDKPVPISNALQSASLDGVMVHRYPYHQPAPSIDVDPFRAEYDNREIQRHLIQCLAAFRPDVVNAFHLYRISAAAINTVRAAGIPMAFTVTDYWPVCPAINLRLPDGSVCRGPDRNGFNCLQHLGGARVPAWLKHLPAPIMEAGATWTRWRHRNQLEHVPTDYAASLILRQSFLRKQLRRLNAVVVATNVVKERLVAFGVDARLMHHLPFGLNLAYLRNAPPKTLSSRLRIGFIGTISEPKGLHVLIRALKLLPVELPIELRIHGRLTDDPAYAEQMQSELAGDTRAAFLGPFPNPKIGEVLAEIDVLVVPSVWLENTPLVIGTAQAARTPVIATNLGGMSEAITHNVNGMLFPVGDHSALATCVRRLIDEPQLLAKLALNALQPMSIEEYAAAQVTIFQDIKGKSA